MNNRHDDYCYEDHECNQQKPEYQEWFEDDNARRYREWQSE